MFAWANDLLRYDDAKRSFILAAMNTFAIAVYMFWSLIFYNTTQSPMWHEGSIAMLCMGSALGLSTILMRWLEKRNVSTTILTADANSEVEKVPELADKKPLDV